MLGELDVALRSAPRSCATRIAGANFAIGVGDGLIVGRLHGAIATSSTRERRWFDSEGQELHHVLDPRTDRPAAGSIDSATVIAGDTATADALATALLVDPKPVLATVATLGLHALARDRDGSWWMTAGAPARGARGADTVLPWSTEAST